MLTCTWQEVWKRSSMRSTVFRVTCLLKVILKKLCESKGYWRLLELFFLRSPFRVNIMKRLAYSPSYIITFDSNS